MQFYKWLKMYNLLIYNCIIFYVVSWIFIFSIPASSTKGL